MQSIEMIRPARKITGMSAILLPFDSDGKVDWQSFGSHVQRTVDAGLIPAVNMDTGYVNLIDEATQAQALSVTRSLTDTFVAGAFVSDQEGDSFDEDRYLRRCEVIQQAGGTPVIFQSFGLTQQSDAAIVDAYQRIGSGCDRFIGFELGTMFAPFGKIYSLDVYEQLMKLPQCVGAKHSSLKREAEWDRLRLRDQVRKDFMVLTGNDLAIDMVMYGSDYLLGLSTFCPDLFGRRDQFWLDGDDRFFALNDILQYLGFFAFRRPVPAYKHTAAMFLYQKGWTKTDRTHPDSPKRPESDNEVLADIQRLLDELD